MVYVQIAGGPAIDSRGGSGSVRIALAGYVTEHTAVNALRWLAQRSTKSTTPDFITALSGVSEHVIHKQ